ncbi:MAG: GAF domain-containing protein [Desulfarculaceae bacterium]|nr:GAF domain-containing protein [Desulfarculaceae bacterium]MCF8072223.1 GAF domain-containing protein [Desulfarculaceae bacterium]MCF8100144.1 GAF domain-containing protein [Desulfarculaceae bacterium]MCF8117207.1 GAF domain-containing protein [Desulfarculaceae bacterium]
MLLGDQAQTQFPFECVLSLEPLIDYLKERLASGAWPANPLGEGLLTRLDEARSLRGNLGDLAVLEEHKGLLLRLMSLLFPPASWDTEAFCAVVPFVLTPFIYSDPYRELFLEPQEGWEVRRNVDEETWVRGRAIKAYLFILDQFYGMKQKLDYPLAMTVADRATGLARHFALSLDFRFVRVQTVGEPIELDDEKREFVLHYLDQPERLKEVLPPERFRLAGFTTLKATEVTAFETISALSRDLIDQETVVTQAGFERLQGRLRTFFRQPELLASLAAIHQDQVLLLNAGCQIDSDCLFNGSRHEPLENFKGTLFEELVASDRVVTVADVTTHPGLQDMGIEYAQHGVRSLMLAPLFYQGECIGSLEVGLPGVDQFTPTDAALMTQLQPLFTVAVQNSLEDLDKRIQTVIKQQCTAVHPSVEWRFKQAAFRHLENQRGGEAGEMEPIVFHDVHPLFATSDIRGSSAERNRAITKDLDRHLELGLSVVRAAGTSKPLPILAELAGRIQRRRERLAKGMSSSDEVGVAHFLRNELESVFEDLNGQGPEVAEAIAAYRREVDPHLGTVYHARRRFEQSVSLLNERLANYLDREEEAIQASLPHYYERHRTDGVDYIIYLGASLNPDGRFSRLYLSNFRLWQLMVTCGLAWHTHQLKDDLPVPLDTAHLVLVQQAPLSIRFRYDEKRFDVDGAYDVRHEIIRSRLDKATIRGGERLTQPGMLAMVYSQVDEAREMRRHIDHLQQEGFLLPEVEKHSLEDLPGVQGLKALRVGIGLDSPALAQRASGALKPA